jgi:outer membrane protein TolC
MPNRHRSHGVWNALAIAALLVACVARTGSCQQPSAEPDSPTSYGPRLPLATIIAQTLAHSPSVAGAAGVVRTAAASRKVAVGAYLPSLSLNAVGGWSDQSAGGTAASSVARQSAVSEGVTALVDVFTGGRRAAQRSESEALSRAADAGFVLQRYTSTYTAMRAYLDVLRAHELTRVADDQVAQTGVGLQYAQRRESAGTATHADVLSAQLAVSTARQQQLAALDTLNMTTASLGRLVGASGPVDAEPAALEPVPLAMRDSDVVALAIASAPAVTVTQAQALADVASVRAARTLYVPTIAAGAGYNWSNNTGFPGSGRPGWIMTVTTSFPLFDGFVREAVVTQAAVAADVASVTATDTRRFVGAEAQRLLGTLHVAESSVALTQESVRLASENLRLFRARYGAGIATILDVLTAQSSLVQAELSVVSARFNYQSTRASLEALLGRPLDEGRMRR